MITTSDFTFEPGLTHGLVGRNGIGKTTLLRRIAGHLPSAGVRVDGQTPFDNPAVLDKTILMGIDTPLIDGWNTRKLMTIGKARWHTWDAHRAEELIARFDLPSTNYGNLSRGQKSALGIVFAVASGCENMLLDEPYLGLDARNQEVFYEILQEEHGRTIIVSTHHLDDLAAYLDTVSLMGENPLTGRVEEILEGVLELTGNPEQLDRALSRLDVPVLERHEGKLGSKALVDARPNLTDAVFEQARELGLRASEVTLARAVAALAQVGGERNA